MTDGDIRFDYMIASRDPGLSLSIMQLVRGLRTFANAVQSKLEELEGNPLPNKELILQERIILETTRREIRRLERKAIYFELDE